MAMRYRELLEMLKSYGFGEAMRVPGHNSEIGVISNIRQRIVIPFAFPNYPVVLDDGENTVVDDEIIQAIFRWIEKQTGERPKHQ